MTKENEQSTKPKMTTLKFSALYWLCTIIITVIATLILSSYASSDVTALEGAKAFTYVYAVIFFSISLSIIGLIIYLIWLFVRLGRQKEQKIAQKKSANPDTSN